MLKGMDKRNIMTLLQTTSLTICITQVSAYLLLLICFNFSISTHITGVAGIKVKVFTTTLDTPGRHELLGMCSLNYVVNYIFQRFCLNLNVVNYVVNYDFQQFNLNFI